MCILFTYKKSLIFEKSYKGKSGALLKYDVSCTSQDDIGAPRLAFELQEWPP